MDERIISSHVSPLFGVGVDGELLGAVVLRVRVRKKRSEETTWHLKKESPGKWRLEFWRELDGIEVGLSGSPIAIVAATKRQAALTARKVIEARKKAELDDEVARKREDEYLVANHPFAKLSWEESSIITDAWIRVHKAAYPNLFSIPKHEKNSNVIKEALLVDSIANGDMGSVDLESITPQIAEKVARTKIRMVDPLNAWVVANWFHGRRLCAMSPIQRMDIARHYGFGATIESLKMRLTRLGLTVRGQS